MRRSQERPESIKICYLHGIFKQAFGGPGFPILCP